MLLFILRRMAFFLPTLLVISVIIFGLSKITSGDPVANKLQSSSESNNVSALSDDLYLQTALELGLDKPVFYFDITARAFPYDFYKIIRKDQNTALKSLIKQYGNWSDIAAYHHGVNTFLSKIPTNDTLGFISNLQYLLIQDDDEKILFNLNELQDIAFKNKLFIEEVQQLNENYQTVKNRATRSKLFIPAFHWYGFDNQYHHWLINFLKGNWGKANNGQSIINKISTPLSITLFISIPALILAYLIGVPIGIFIAANRRKRSGKWLMKSIFALYSLPTFWISLMAIRFLTTPEFGLKVFPSAGLSNLNTSVSTIEYLISNMPNFILPILCMIIHSMAYIARLTQGSILDNLSLDYVRTARAKGLKSNAILRNHVLKNASFPLITIFGHLLPMLITGSFVVDYVFNIKGMGRVAFEANSEQDWQVVYAVLMFSAVMVLVGNLVSDILYKWANPRIELT